MPARASGQSIRDVLLNFTIKDDAGNAAKIRAQGQRAKKAEEDGQQSASRAEEQRERDSARTHLAMMARQRAYAAEVRKHEREQEAAGARMSRQIDKRNRDQEQWGARLAKQMDSEIRAREQAEERARSGRVRAREGRERENAAGWSQATNGGARAVRGLLEIGAAHSFGARAGEGPNSQRTTQLLQNLVQIQGIFDLLGSVDLARGLARTGMGRSLRGVAMRGSRGIVSAAEGLAGAVGASGVAAPGAGLMGTAGAALGAGAAALAGGGLGAYAIGDFAHSVYKNGFGGGAQPGSYTDRVGNMWGDAATSVGGGMTQMGLGGYLNRNKNHWLGGILNAGADADRTGRRAARMERQNTQQLTHQQEIDANLQDLFEFENQPRDIAAMQRSAARANVLRRNLIPQGAMLTGSAGLERQLEGVNFGKSFIARELSDVAGQRAGLDPADNKKRIELDQQALELERQRIPLLEQAKQLERSILQIKIEQLSKQGEAQLGRAGGFSEGLRGAQIRAGRATPQELARLESLLAQEKAGGLLSTESKDFIDSFKGRAGQESREADYQKKGADVLSRLGLDADEIGGLHASSQGAAELKKTEMDLRVNLAVKLEGNYEKQAEAIADRVIEAMVRAMNSANAEANKQKESSRRASGR